MEKATADTLTLRVVEELEVLRRLQKTLKSLTGVFLDILDSEARTSFRFKPLGKYQPFCKLINSSAAGHRACLESDKKGAAECLKTGKPVICRCHIGLEEVFVPLIIKSRPVGILASGQFLFSNPTRAEFEKIAPVIRELGLDVAGAKRTFLALPVMNKKKAASVAELISLVADYIVDSSGRMQELKNIRRSDHLQRAQEFMENKYAGKCSLHDVALSVGLSPSRLSHLFREKLHVGFTKYLNDVRLKQARYLLTNSSLQIIRIAYRSGFRTPTYFNRIFKKAAGCSPLEYRKQRKNAAN